MAIANFGSFYIEASELIKVSGQIDYPYIKFPRLRNYTTLQIAAKTREKIDLQLVFTDNAQDRNDELETLGALRSQSTLNIGSKNWGKYQIESISRSVDFGNRQEVTVTLTQTEQITPTGDFGLQTNVIGNYGLFSIKREELLEGVKWDLNYPTIELERLQSFPKIQNAGDDLKELQAKLRFDESYNAYPMLRLDTIRVLADFYVFYNLTVLGIDYGDYVVKSLAWEYKLLTSIGDAKQLDVTVSLLQSPTGLPPKLPVIDSILVNGIQKVLELGGGINSITFEDALDNNSLLEIEFDAAVTGIPGEGDTIRIVWKYSGDANVLDTGLMMCDRPLRKYTPDTVTVGAQSLNWTSTIDTQQYISYSNTQLNTIVSAIASTYSLTLTSNAATIIAGVAPNTSSAVLVEGNSYYEILTDLARDYGYAIRLRYDKLFFQSISGLETAATQFLLTPTDCLSAEFIQKVRDTYSQAIFPYKGINTSATVVDSSSPAGSILDFRTGNQFWNDATAAIARSSGELKFYNTKRHTGTIGIEGRWDATASNNIQLAGFDNVSDNGKFMINKATHSLSATQGWQTQLEIRKVF